MDLPTSAERFASFLLGSAVLLTVGAILALVGAVIAAVWRGEFMLRPLAIGAARSPAGRVVLTGTVGPAWTWLVAPLGGSACVYYESFARSSLPFRSAQIRERNAVPFVLADESGRILVLARRARWGAGRGRRPAEPDRPAGLRPPGPPAEPPPCLDSYRKNFSEGLARAIGAREAMVRVGDVVTVSGVLVDFESTMPAARIGCPDDGRGLGLRTSLVLAPAGLRGLVVTPRSPSQIRRRAWLALARCVVGVPVVAAAGITAVVLLLPLTAVGR